MEISPGGGLFLASKTGLILESASVLRAWRARSGGNSPGTEYVAPVREGHLQQLRDEISNLVNVIAHGALRFITTISARFRENPRETRTMARKVFIRKKSHRQAMAAGYTSIERES
jgi:hypothetical protein